jgi:hypothetical protein
LDRIREVLTGRGIGAGASSLAISSALAIENAALASAAPADLLASTVNIAILSNTATTGVTGGSIAASIAKGVGQIMTLAKIKVASGVACAAILTGAGAVPLVNAANRWLSLPVTQTAITTLVTTQAAPAADQPAFTAEVNDKTKVTILGVSSYPPDEDTWFAADGTPIECPRPSLLNAGHNVRANPAPDYAVAVKIDKPESTVVRMEINNAPVVANSQVRDDDETIMLCAFRLDNASPEFSFRVGISDTPWKTVAASETPTEQTTFDAADIGQVTFEPIDSDGQGCKVEASYPAIRTPNHIIVIDDAGKEHISQNINIRSDGQNHTATCTFDCPAEKVKQVRLQTREFNKHVEASGISLEKDHKTEPVMKVTEEGK